ncbi:MAG: hypothetical protein JWQ43_603 [Glaciihabitans sp.]|nr:hypothetical protein [Glaciihabitans sp.]
MITTPEISWSPAASVPLETNRYVEAARAADLGYAVAHNAADFTIELFTSTRSVDEVGYTADGFVASYVGNDNTPQVFPGPAIRLPLEVVENAAGDGADITFCEASYNWLLTADRPQTRPELSAGSIVTVQIGTSAQSGELVEMSDSGSNQDCDASGAAVGVFIPVPDIPETLTEDDVRMPLGSKD